MAALGIKIIALHPVFKTIVVVLDLCFLFL